MIDSGVIHNDTALQLSLFNFTITEFRGEIITYGFENNFRGKSTAFKH